MTRRRIIAGVILLAAVAVAIPAAPGVWERVAYVEIPPSRSTGQQSNGIRVSMKQGRLMVESSTMTVLRKRHAWIPGDEFRVPDQVCPQCSTGEHTGCFSRHVRGMRGRRRQSGTVVDLFSAFRCTCTDPSHDGDSE